MIVIFSVLFVHLCILNQEIYKGIGLNNNDNNNYVFHFFFLIFAQLWKIWQIQYLKRTR